MNEIIFIECSDRLCKSRALPLFHISRPSFSPLQEEHLYSDQINCRQNPDSPDQSVKNKKSPNNLMKPQSPHVSSKSISRLFHLLFLIIPSTDWDMLTQLSWRKGAYLYRIFRSWRDTAPRRRPRAISILRTNFQGNFRTFSTERGVLMVKPALNQIIRQMNEADKILFSRPGKRNSEFRLPHNKNALSWCVSSRSEDEAR